MLGLQASVDERFVMVRGDGIVVTVIALPSGITLIFPSESEARRLFMPDEEMPLITNSDQDAIRASVNALQAAIKAVAIAHRYISEDNAGEREPREDTSAS
jgi:hypothetical protein